MFLYCSSVGRNLALKYSVLRVVMPLVRGTRRKEGGGIYMLIIIIINMKKDEQQIIVLPSGILRPCTAL